MRHIFLTSALCLIPIADPPQDQDDLIRVELVATRTSQKRSQNLMARFVPLQSENREPIEITFPSHSHPPAERSLMNMIRNCAGTASNTDPYKWRQVETTATFLISKDKSGYQTDLGGMIFLSLGETPKSNITMADCHKEVTELHQFFEDWFTGKLPKDEPSFSRFSNAMSKEFEMITPSGKIVGRGPLVERLRAAHGSKNPSFRIRITYLQTQILSNELFLVTYKERQEEDGEMTERLSTAVMGYRFDAPRKLEWIRVHETWIENEGGNAPEK